MPLDADVTELIAQLEAAGAPPATELSPEEAREVFAGAVAWQGEPEAIAEVSDHQVPGPAGAIPIRIYRPASAAEPAPVLYYIHGGGWVIMDLDSHDPLCRAFANALGCVVVAVHYRRAPEARFPAAVEDSFAVLQWIQKSGGDHGIDPARIAIAGDSAGGNLAAAMTLRAREAGIPLCAQVLHCPVTDHRFDRASYAANAEGLFLTKDLMEWFWGHYLGPQGSGADPMASPLRAADLSGLPPALVQTAEFDPLRDEGREYADKLRNAGTAVTYTDYPGVVHDPWLMIGVVGKGRRSLEEAVAFLRAPMGLS